MAIRQLRTVVLRFDKGSGRESSPGWLQGQNFWGAFRSASVKKDWATNEDAVGIKLAVPYATDFIFGR